MVIVEEGAESFCILMKAYISEVLLHHGKEVKPVSCQQGPTFFEIGDNSKPASDRIKF
jgi:hypothetical protein